MNSYEIDSSVAQYKRSDGYHGHGVVGKDRCLFITNNFWPLKEYKCIYVFNLRSKLCSELLWHNLIQGSGADPGFQGRGGGGGGVHLE
jgi:hypothetical protein